MWYAVGASPGAASHLFLPGQPLNRLLTANPNSAEKIRSAILEVAADRAYFRMVILDRVRPKLEERMAPANWFHRYCKITELCVVAERVTGPCE